MLQYATKYIQNVILSYWINCTAPINSPIPEDAPVTNTRFPKSWSDMLFGPQLVSVQSVQSMK
jgi:hypothetical protein